MSASPTIGSIRNWERVVQKCLAQAEDAVTPLIDLRNRVIETFDAFLTTWLSGKGNGAAAAATYVSFERLQTARQSMIAAIHSHMMPRFGVMPEQGDKQGEKPPTGGNPLPRLEQCITTLEGRAEAYATTLPSVLTLHDDQDLLSRIQVCLQRVSRAGEGQVDLRIGLLIGRCTALSTKFDELLPTACERQGEGFFREQFAWVQGVYAQLIGEPGSAEPHKSDLAWPHFKYVWCLTRLKRLSVEAKAFKDLVGQINMLRQEIQAHVQEDLFTHTTILGTWFQDISPVLKQDLVSLETQAAPGEATWVDRHRLYATIMGAIEALTAALEARPGVRTVRYERGETLSEHIARFTEEVERRFAAIDAKLPPEEVWELPSDEKKKDDDEIPVAKYCDQGRPLSSFTWQWPEIDPRIVMTVAGVGLSILVLRKLWQKRPKPRVPIVVRPDFIVRPSPYRAIPVSG